MLAKWAATVDHVSGGRLLLGVGAGWQENEHEQYGIPLGSPGERIDRFEEALPGPAKACGAATTTSSASTTGGDAIAEPKPVQAPLPILVGGKGDRMLGVVARHADEWNMWSSPEQIAERGACSTRLREERRDPVVDRGGRRRRCSSSSTTHQAYELGAPRWRPGPPSAGPPEQIAISSPPGATPRRRADRARLAATARAPPDRPPSTPLVEQSRSNCTDSGLHIIDG